jgi:hypothetical protein
LSNYLSSVALSNVSIFGLAGGGVAIGFAGSALSVNKDENGQFFIQPPTKEEKGQELA